MNDALSELEAQLKSASCDYREILAICYNKQPFQLWSLELPSRDRQAAVFRKVLLLEMDLNHLDTVPHSNAVFKHTVLSWPSETLTLRTCRRLAQLWSGKISVRLVKKLSHPRNILQTRHCTDNLHVEYFAMTGAELLEELDAFQLGDNPAYVWFWLMNYVRMINFFVTANFSEIHLPTAAAGLDRYQNTIVFLERFVMTMGRVNPRTACETWWGFFRKYNVWDNDEALILTLSLQPDTRTVKTRCRDLIGRILSKVVAENTRHAQQNPTPIPFPNLTMWASCSPLREHLSARWRACYFALGLRFSARMLHVLYSNGVFKLEE